MTTWFSVLCLLVTPRYICANGVKQLVLSVCPSVRHRKVFITGDLESTTTSKREDNDEIRRILADVYLIEYKYFPLFSGHPPHSLLGRDIRIQIRHGNARHSEDSFTKTESEGSTILAIATANLCMSVPLGTGQRAHAYIMRLLFNEYRACLELLEAAVYLCNSVSYCRHAP